MREFIRKKLNGTFLQSVIWRRKHVRPNMAKYRSAEFLRQEYDDCLNQSIPFDMHFGGRPGVQALEINNSCNLDCIMCRPSVATRKAILMEPEIFEKAVVEARRAGQARLGTFMSSDPLMNPRLESYFQILEKHGMRCDISTNLILLHKTINLLCKYARVIDGIRVSADGATKEVYEKMRYPAKYEKFMENLELLKKVNKTSVYFPVSISSVVSEDNRGELAYYFEFYRKYFVFDAISAHLVGGLSPDNSYFLEKAELKKYSERALPCYMPFSGEMYVLSDGRVSCCCRDINGELAVGDIGDGGSFAEIVNSDAAKAIRRAHLARSDENLAPVCVKCHMTQGRVRALFELFIEALKYKHYDDWRAEAIQPKIDRFFDVFENDFPDFQEFQALIH